MRINQAKIKLFSKYLAALFIGIGLAGCNENIIDAVPEKPTKTAKVAAIKYYKNVIAAMQSCENSGKILGAALNSNDAVGAYNAADAMEDVCGQASLAIGEIEIPMDVGKNNYAVLQRAQTACSDVMIMKVGAADKLKVALDNPSVAAKAELQNYNEIIEADQLQCAANLTEPAIALGAVQSEL